MSKPRYFLSFYRPTHEVASMDDLDEARVAKFIEYIQNADSNIQKRVLLAVSYDLWESDQLTWLYKIYMALDSSLIETTFNDLSVPDICAWATYRTGFETKIITGQYFVPFFTDIQCIDYNVFNKLPFENNDFPVEFKLHVNYYCMDKVQEIDFAIGRMAAQYN